MGRLLLTTCLFTLATYVGIHMRMPLVPLYAGTLGADKAEVGLINAGFMIVAAVASIPLSLASDRVGRKPLVVFGVASAGVVSLALPLAKTPLALGLLYLAAGVGVGAFFPAMMALVTDVAGASRAGQAYGWLTLSTQMGMSLGPTVGGVVADALGYASAFLVSGALVLACAALMHLELPTTRPPQTPRAVAPLHGVGLLVRNRLVVAGWLGAMSCTFAWGGLMAFFPLYGQDLGLSTGLIGALLGVHAVANALSRLPAGYVTDRLGRPVPLIVGALLAYALALNLLGQVATLPGLGVMALVMGGAAGTAFVTLGAVVGSSSDPRLRGLA
ncbi:MAG TPA: MFS transporter, partial [Chloroflexota bacterium]